MNNNLLEGIDTIIIRVSDIERASAWYLEKLGFNIIHQDSTLKLAVFDTQSAVSITLWQTGESIKPNPHTASYPIFRSSDAPRAREVMIAKGIRTGELITDHAVTYFTFFDPDGNPMEVCQVHT